MAKGKKTGGRKKGSKNTYSKCKKGTRRYGGKWGGDCAPYPWPELKRCAPGENGVYKAAEDAFECAVRDNYVKKIRARKQRRRLIRGDRRERRDRNIAAALRSLDV